MKKTAFLSAGHGTTGTLKVPTKVQNIESIRQVDCGAAHTICLSMDSVRVWSFGAGDSGKLRHGDTNRHLLPKVSMTVCVHVEKKGKTKICSQSFSVKKTNCPGWDSKP